MKQELEKQLITDYLKDKLIASGWQFVAGNELDRNGLEEPLLIKNLCQAVKWEPSKCFTI
jgi:hypothetical protein